jgi:hypothetical protein
MIGGIKSGGLGEEMIAGMGQLRVVLPHMGMWKRERAMAIGWRWIVVVMEGAKLKSKFGIKRGRLRRLCMGFGGNGIFEAYLVSYAWVRVDNV